MSKDYNMLNSSDILDVELYMVKACFLDFSKPKTEVLALCICLVSSDGVY